MESLKSKMLKGMLWITIDRYSGLVLSIVVSMVLARLLTPSEFGLVALATVLLSFISIISGMGLAPAIIQEKELTQKDTNSVFTFSVAVGLILSLLFFALSWFIADYYNEPQLRSVCQIASLNFFLGVVNSVPTTLMNKHQRFKEKAICSLLTNTFAGIISISAAYNGFGVYSLMIAPFFNSIITFFYIQRFYRCRLDFHMSMAPIKRMASFSLYQLGFELVNYFSRNLDKLIIGKWMSIKDLGYYDKAYRLMQQPQNNITSILTPVLQPNFAQYQDKMKTMATQYLRVIAVMSSISFPLGVTLFFCGPEIIRLMYGPQWLPAIPCFQILCLSLPCAMISSTTGSIYQASNATKHLFFVGLVNSSGMAVCFVIASFYFRTIEAVALAWTLFSIVGMIFTLTIMFHYVLKTSPLLAYRTFIKPIGNGLLLLIVLLGINSLNTQYWIFSLIIKLSVSLILTLIYMQLTGEARILPIMNSIFRKLKQNK